MSNFVKDVELKGYWKGDQYAVKANIEDTEFDIETGLTGGIGIIHYGQIVDKANDVFEGQGSEVEGIWLGGVRWVK